MVKPDDNQSRTYALKGTGFDAEKQPSGLYVVATPIGNLSDITLRALEVLAGVDLILCEDTRVTGRLLQRYQIATPMRPYHDHNGAKVRPEVINFIVAGKAVALVSDAGLPMVSDPGAKLVESVVATGGDVKIVPGPSASLSAFVLAGFPADRFQFVGFLPQKQGALHSVLSEILAYRGVSIAFESPKRIVKTLAALAELSPGCRIAVARELTKIYEETLRGSPSELAAAISDRGGVKGEITLVIHPDRRAEIEVSDEELEKVLLAALETRSTSAAAGAVARQFGLKKADIYDRAVALKGRERD